jgi:hypothetical protein
MAADRAQEHQLLECSIDAVTVNVAMKERSDPGQAGWSWLKAG